MALHIPFEAFRILRLLFYGKVQFTTSVRSINRQYHSVTAMLVKRFNVVFNLTQFYSETLYLYLRVFTAAINNIPVSINLTEVSGTVIEFSKGSRNKTSGRLFGSTPVSAHELRSGNPQFAGLSGRKLLARRGCNHVVHTRERLPDCRHAVMVFGSFSRDYIRSAVDGGFGRSVEVDYRGIGYARAKFIEQIHVSGFGCDDEIA